MDRATFDAITQATIERTARILIAKGTEYAGDGDRLANFKRNAEKNGQTIFECWQIYWSKHIDSINSYMVRVKNRAVELALEQVIEDDQAARKENNGNMRKEAINPERFRKRVNGNLLQAMQEVELTLSEPIEGRFDDNINYSILCQAILKELRDETVTTINGDSRP